jgi:quercetin dioxygenase-like cupin family protein
VSLVVFGFDAGQALSEHTASRPALLQILRGEARLTLASDTVEVAAGSWAQMPAGLPHSVYAMTPLLMLLVLLPALTAARRVVAATTPNEPKVRGVPP